jgi:hypothetical protein
MEEGDLYGTLVVFHHGSPGAAVPSSRSTGLLRSAGSGW